MKSRNRRISLIVPVLALALVVPGTAMAEPATTGAQALTTAWSAAMQRPSIGFEKNWAEEGFSRQSVRQVVRVTAGGKGVRIRLSNQYGASPLKVAGATIALAGKGAAVRQGTVRRLTFGRAEQMVIPVGGQVASDLADLEVKAMEQVTVTLYLPETTGPATTHLQGYATTYRSGGDHRADTDGSAFTDKDTTHSWYFLSAVDVAANRRNTRQTVVALGDSITDGFGSGNDANNRYPDELAERLTAAGKPRPVLNAGIGGGMVLSDSAWFGEKLGTRLRRDVLDNPRVGTMIVLGGLNDIGFSEIDLPTYKPNPDRSVADLIAGHRDLIRRAHDKGIKVVGATLLPMKGAEYYTPSSAEKIRLLNEWIRTSGEYDAVADFNKAVADPADPEKLRADFDSGDHKHPNAAGYSAMAGAVDLDSLW